MVTNLEQTVLDKFRQLPSAKQREVLQFLDLMEQDLLEKPTEEEAKEAKKILSRAKEKALSYPPKSAQELWQEFNQAKNTIAQEYENPEEPG